MISVQNILQDGKTIIISGERKFRDRKKGVWGYVWLIILIVMLMGIDAYMRSMTTDHRYRVSKVYGEIKNLQGKKEELNAKIAYLKNPRRIEKIALQKLGLKEPEGEVLKRR